MVLIFVIVTVFSVRLLLKLSHHQKDNIYDYPFDDETVSKEVEQKTQLQLQKLEPLTNQEAVRLLLKLSHHQKDNHILTIVYITLFLLL
jgi:hypothetical protein